MTADPPYTDPTESTEVRIDDLMERMTLEEKVGQLVGMQVGSFINQDRRGKQTNSVPDVEAAIREQYIGTVTPFGTGVSRYNNVAVAGRIANRLQRVAMNETRLGIPLLIPVDAVHGHANIEGSTVFPHNLGMAATWDPDLVERAARVTATEMSATGANQNYSPTADVAREPRWGRTYETYGESTTLVEELVSAEIQGLQGDDLSDSTAVAATVKHYPGSGGPARGEDTARIDVSQATLHRVYLPPFERAIDDGVAALMPAYNAIGNEPAHASKFYLSEMLRDQFGFEGIVCSDWFAVAFLAERYQVAETLRDATELSTDAGLDVASVGGPQHAEDLRSLVESNRLDEGRIEESVRRILGLKFELGLFDDPYVPAELAPETVGSDEHREVAHEAALKSVTLLRNRDDTLPLENPDEVFVTGPNAGSLDNLLSGWTVFGLDSSRGRTVAEGIEHVAGPSTNVAYDPGTVSNLTLQLDEVARNAEQADAAVVVLGEPWYLHEFGPESVIDSDGSFPSRNELQLPENQKELLRTVSETGTPTVLVLVTGRPLVLSDVLEWTDAVLVGFFPGIEGGTAIAELLFGAENPSGRLPISFPRSTGDLPVVHDWLPHPNPIGSQEHPPSYDPLFDFGFGLSYTEFDYESLEVPDRPVSAREETTVEVTVTNVGERRGTETVQLFGQCLLSSVVTPVRELLDFERVTLDSGETATVRFDLPPSAFATTRPDGSRTRDPASFELYVENLSKKLDLQ
ncbi:glycoside hydrolase family 3 N-terminal domain-containing protein [Halobaculum sp. P14]|uniref:glycoside hydrolase family 3 N-terminal domain-containing protein n=1 Tax=Halobaculum sp. P14 TaxID=3421638 RepID=UPI003EB6DF8E